MNHDRYWMGDEYDYIQRECRAQALADMAREGDGEDGDVYDSDPASQAGGGAGPSPASSATPEEWGDR